MKRITQVSDYTGLTVFPSNVYVILYARIHKKVSVVITNQCFSSSPDRLFICVVLPIGDLEHFPLAVQREVKGQRQGLYGHRHNQRKTQHLQTNKMVGTIEKTVYCRIYYQRYGSERYGQCFNQREKQHLQLSAKILIRQYSCHLLQKIDNEHCTKLVNCCSYGCLIFLNLFCHLFSKGFFCFVFVRLFVDLFVFICSFV